MLDNIEFYRVEDLIKEYEDYINEEEAKHKKQQEEYEKKYKTQSPPSMDNVMRGMSNYGGFKIPNMNIPKLG